jgi:hypothetical protein
LEGALAKGLSQEPVDLRAPAMPGAEVLRPHGGAAGVALLGDDAGEGRAGHVFADDVVIAAVEAEAEDGDDRRVSQGGGAAAGPLAESRQGLLGTRQVAGEHLERHLAVQDRVVGEVDNPHATLADPAEDPELVDLTWRVHAGRGRRVQWRRLLDGTGLRLGVVEEECLDASPGGVVRAGTAEEGRTILGWKAQCGQEHGLFIAHAPAPFSAFSLERQEGRAGPGGG